MEFLANTILVMDHCENFQLTSTMFDRMINQLRVLYECDLKHPQFPIWPKHLLTRAGKPVFTTIEDFENLYEDGSE